MIGQSTVKEIITYKQWDIAVGRAFNAEIRRAGIASSRGTISAKCHQYVIEVMDDRQCLLVREGWRLAIKKAATP